MNRDSESDVDTSPELPHAKRDRVAIEASESELEARTEGQLWRALGQLEGKHDATVNHLASRIDSVEREVSASGRENRAAIATIRVAQVEQNERIAQIVLEAERERLDMIAKQNAERIKRENDQAETQAKIAKWRFVATTAGITVIVCILLARMYGLIGY